MRISIEADRGKIEEVAFSLVNRFWAIFVKLEFLGFLGGWSVRMECVVGPGFASGAEPLTPPAAVKFTIKGRWMVIAIQKLFEWVLNRCMATRKIS